MTSLNPSEVLESGQIAQDKINKDKLFGFNTADSYLHVCFNFLIEMT